MSAVEEYFVFLAKLKVIAIFVIISPSYFALKPKPHYLVIPSTFPYLSCFSSNSYLNLLLVHTIG